MTTTRALTPEEQAVLDIITQHRALISIVFDVVDDTLKGPQIDYHGIDEDYLDQLADPTKNRPSRSAKFFASEERPRPDVLKKMDMRTGEIFEYHPGTCRDTKHKGITFQHTAKTATSLIPPDPRYMELFFCDKGIGFLWDINDCDIKDERYVFFNRGGTDSFFWGDIDTSEKLEELKESLREKPLETIDGLRKKNIDAIKQNKSINHNEILAGLPKGKLNAVFAPLDEMSVRLRAFRAMLHAKEKLGFEKDLPILIIQPYYHISGDDPDPTPNRPAVFRFYSVEEREADLKAELADKVAEQAAIEVIKSHRALALPILDEKSFDDYLDQIADPNTHRPSLSEAFFKQQGVTRPESLEKMNLKTFKLHKHKPGQCRETKHAGVDYKHTAKLPVSLLPPEPQWMDLGGNDGSMEFGRVGLLFDIDTCDMKHAKYVFPHQEDMSTCFWLNIDSEEKKIALMQRFETAPVGSLNALRAQNDKAVTEQKIIGANTIFAGLPKGKIVGIFCLVLDFENYRDHTLAAQKYALQIKEKLGLAHVPIFIHQPVSSGLSPVPVFRVYGKNEQLDDRLEAKVQYEDVASPVQEMRVSAHSTSTSMHEFSTRSMQPRKPLSLFDSHSGVTESKALLPLPNSLPQLKA